MNFLNSNIKVYAYQSYMFFYENYVNFLVFIIIIIIIIIIITRNNFYFLLVFDW